MTKVSRKEIENQKEEMRKGGIKAVVVLPHSNCARKASILFVKEGYAVEPVPSVGLLKSFPGFVMPGHGVGYFHNLHEPWAHFALKLLMYIGIAEPRTVRVYVFGRETFRTAYEQAPNKQSAIPLRPLGSQSSRLH